MTFVPSFVYESASLISYSHPTSNPSKSRQDMVLCRKMRGLERRIAREGETAGLKCQVKYWEDAWEVEEQFGELQSPS